MKDVKTVYLDVKIINCLDVSMVIGLRWMSVRMTWFVIVK